jgi:hypothetical protein
MITPKTLRQIAAYGISLPALAVSPKLAKETVYMPSQLAAQLLGRATDTAERGMGPMGGAGGPVVPESLAAR